MISKELLKIISSLNLNLDEKFPEANLDNKSKILASCIKMNEEVGELSGEILTSIGRARKEKLENYSENDLKGEFADVIITTLLLADLKGIDINEALKMKFDKINNRGGV